MAISELREETGLKSIRPGDGLDMGAKETKVSRMALGFWLAQLLPFSDVKNTCARSHMFSFEHYLGKPQ